jgi:hypothetical protein
MNIIHDDIIMMIPIPDHMLWCYGEYQTLYGTVDGVDFQQGFPDLDTLDPRENHLIILDDLMNETDQRVARAKASRKNGVLLGYIWCASAMICDTFVRFWNRPM